MTTIEMIQDLGKEGQPGNWAGPPSHKQAPSYTYMETNLQRKHLDHYAFDACKFEEMK